MSTETAASRPTTRASRQALRPIALSARLAPSVHNTQPWTFGIEPGRLTIRADRSRQLRVLDPTGRQLLISCGCALLNARVAAAAAGLQTRVARLPDEHDPDLVARLSIGGPDHHPTANERALAALARLVESRRSNRRRFSRDPVPSAVLHALSAAASAEGARLVPVEHESERDLIADLSTRADDAQFHNPAYRAELRAWTTDDPNRVDGVPAIAVPHVDADSGDEIPIRDFDARGTGALPVETRSTRDQCLVLLVTATDEPSAWVRTGEALERVLLEITAHGFAASPLTQVVEVPAAREALRAGLHLNGYPQLLLRVGKAAPTAGTPRRHLADLLVDETHD